MESRFADVGSGLIYSPFSRWLVAQAATGPYLAQVCQG
jgi:hypothetical protein